MLPAAWGFVLASAAAIPPAKVTGLAPGTSRRASTFEIDPLPIVDNHVRYFHHPPPPSRHQVARQASRITLQPQAKSATRAQAAAAARRRASASSSPPHGASMFTWKKTSNNVASPLSQVAPPSDSIPYSLTPGR
ncbi:hypothetical protein VDGL01_01543 [Verticillium dahliae]